MTEPTRIEFRLDQTVEVIVPCVNPRCSETCDGDIISLWRTESGEIDVLVDFGERGRVCYEGNALKWNPKFSHWRERDDDRPFDQPWA